MYLLLTPTIGPAAKMLGARWWRVSNDRACALKLAVVLLRIIAALTFCAPSTGFEAGLRWGLTLLPGAGRHLVVAGRRESGLTDSRLRDGLSSGNHRMPAREVP